MGELAGGSGSRQGRRLGDETDDTIAVRVGKGGLYVLANLYGDDPGLFLALPPLEAGG